MKDRPDSGQNANNVWYETADRVHKLGMNFRAKMPFASEEMSFLLRVYLSPTSHLQDMVLTGGLSPAARRAMPGVAEILRAFNAPAALVQSDSRQLDVNKFAAYFKLAAKLTAREVLEEYHRVLNEHYEGTMANLPRELWYDALTTVIKGPKMMPLLIKTAYHGDKDGNVEWEETLGHGGLTDFLLPDWWDEAVQ
jgi:hypothetical protein